MGKTFRSSLVETLKSLSSREGLLVLAVSLGLVSLFAVRTASRTYSSSEFQNPWDHHKYLSMAAGNPFDFHIAPFGWRVVNPLLAKLLPFDLQTNFYLLSFAFIWLTGPAVFYLARQFHPEPAYGWLGLGMFFAMGWASRKGINDFWRPDALHLLLLTLAFSALVARRDWFFAGLLAFGVGVKESIVFAVPLYYTFRSSLVETFRSSLVETFHAQKWLDWPAARRTALLALPAFAVLFALRLGIPARNADPAYLASLPETLTQVQNGSSAYNLVYLLQTVGLSRLQELSLENLFRYTAGTFGLAACLLPFFAPRKNALLLLKFSPFFVLVYAQLLFAVNTERLLAVAAPAVILLALNGIQAISARLRTSPAWFLGLLLALYAGLLTRPTAYNFPYPLEALLIVLFAGFLLLLPLAKSRL